MMLCPTGESLNIVPYYRRSPATCRPSILPRLQHAAHRPAPPPVFSPAPRVQPRPQRAGLSMERRPAPSVQDYGTQPRPGTQPHFQLLLPLQGELPEGLDDEAGVGAVIDEYRRAAHPRLQVVDRQRDVLRVVLETKHSTCVTHGQTGTRAAGRSWPRAPQEGIASRAGALVGSQDPGRHRPERRRGLMCFKRASLSRACPRSPCVGRTDKRCEAPSAAHWRTGPTLNAHALDTGAQLAARPRGHTHSPGPRSEQPLGSAER